MSVGWSVFWGKIVLLSFFFFFSQLQKVTRKKQQLDQKLFVVSAKGRQGKLEEKRERERNREKEIEREGKRDRQRDHSPVWDTIKKKVPRYLSPLPFSLFPFPFPLFSLFLSMSTSTRAFIHAKITKFRVKRARKYVSTAVAETRW